MSISATLLIVSFVVWGAVKLGLDLYRIRHRLSDPPNQPGTYGSLEDPGEMSIF